MSDEQIPDISNIIPDQDPIQLAVIGAAIVGDSVPCYQPLLDAGKLMLYAFEPDADAAIKLRAGHPSSTICLEAFLGDGNPATFYETTWGPTGSLFKPNLPVLEQFHNLAELCQVVRTSQVDTIRLDDLSEIPSLDAIMIDAQGAELMILENAQRQLSDVVLIQAEACFVELYEGIPRIGDLDRFLRGMGFQWHTQMGFGSRPFMPILNIDHPQRAFNQELWTDVVFVRDWMRFDEVHPTKLIKLAVLLHDIYRSYDLAHRAMAAADRQLGSNYADNYVEWIAS